MSPDPKDKIVLGAPGPLIARVIAGRNAMPAFKNVLKDDEIGAVLTYIRSSWGNKAPAITAAAVAAERKSSR